ncbi:MAG: hypothetical protein EXQ58_10315 [Acidobacteria bacterium]|nr:hypothetical protein [Acidobacteriota bacterium]
MSCSRDRHQALLFTPDKARLFERNEILNYPDLDTSLDEAPKDCKDPYGYKASRDIFRTGLFYLLREGKTSNLNIWEFFPYPLQQIRDCLYTLPMREMGALKHIDKPIPTRRPNPIPFWAGMENFACS